MLLALGVCSYFAAWKPWSRRSRLQYDLTSQGIKVLSNKGNVYYIGRGVQNENYDKFTESLTKYIENVKQVVSSEVWIDNNNDLYIGEGGEPKNR